MEQGIPFFVSSLLGGAAAQLAVAFQGAPMPAHFASETRAGTFYEKPPVSEYDMQTSRDRVFNPVQVWNKFSNLGTEGLARLNKLTPEENRELLTTGAVDRVIALTLTGVARLHGQNRAVRHKNERW